MFYREFQYLKYNTPQRWKTVSEGSWTTRIRGGSEAEKRYGGGGNPDAKGEGQEDATSRPIGYQSGSPKVVLLNQIPVAIVGFQR